MIITRILSGLCSVALLAYGVALLVTAGMKQDASPSIALVYVIIALTLFIGVCGAASLFQWKGREKARKAALSIASLYFGLAILGWLVLAAFVIFGPDREKDQQRIGLALASIFCLFFLCHNALLMRLERLDPSIIAQRSLSRVVWFCIGLVVFVGSGAATTALYVRDRVKTSLISVPPPRPEELVTVPELNIQLRSPGGKWARGAKGALSKDASITLLNGADSRYFIAIAESLKDNPEFTLETLISVARANAEGAAEIFKPSPEQPLEVAGAKGIFLPIEARVSKLDLKYYYWMTVHNGLAIQLITWGKLADAPAIEKDARDLLSRFSFIDPAKSLIDNGPTTVTAPEYGVSVPLQGSAWRVRKDGASDNARLSFRNAASRSADIYPVRLENTSLPEDRIAGALLQFFDFDFPGPQINLTGEKELDGTRVVSFSAEADSDNTRFVYRFRIFRRGDIACLAAAFQPASEPDRAPLEQFLDLVTLGDPAASHVAPGSPGRTGSFWNHAGLKYFEQSEYASAEAAFRNAARANTRNSVYRINVAHSLKRQSKYAEAASFLGEASDAPTTDSLVELQADMFVKAGNPDAALEAYGRLMKFPGSEEKALNHRIHLLCEAKRFDQADEELRAHANLGELRVLKATVLLGRDKPDEAVALLREGLETRPVDTAAGEELIAVCSDLDRHADVIDASDKLTAAGYRTAYTLYRKAVAEFSLDLLPASKRTLEEAAKLDAKDASIRDLLQRVQTRLGTGDATLFQEPIEAVPLPAAAIDNLPSPPEATGVLYDYRVSCFKFEPGKYLRNTIYYRFTVKHRSEVESFSSFRFEFDPDYERLFVNKLEVRDPDGTVVFSGAVSNYFVSNESSTELASQSMQLHVPISALAPGRTVDLVITRREDSSRNFVPFRFLYVTPSYACRRGAVSIDAPEGSFRYETRNGVRVSQAEGITLFLSDAHPAWEDESWSAPLDDFIPLVAFGGTDKDWASIGREYLQTIADRLTIPDSVRARARSLAAGKTDQREIVRAVATWVQSNLTYRAIEFGPRAQIPTQSADILGARTGDCKDHSLLFVQLLQSVDIPAHLVLAATDHAITESIPSRLQFNHMIAYVPSLALFVDLTDKELDPLGGTPYRLNDRQCLVLVPDAPTLKRVPNYTAPAALCDVQRTVEVRGQDLIVREHITMSGIAASWLRAACQVPRNKLKDEFTPLFTRIGAQLTSVDPIDPEDTSKPQVIDLVYRVPAARTEVVGHTALTLPYIYEHRWFLIPHAEQRTTRMQVPYGAVCRSRTTLRLSSGAKLLQPEELVWKKSSNPATAQRTISLADDSIVIDTEVALQQGVYSIQDYEQAADVTTEAIASFERGIVIAGPQSSKP
ncbi:MAG: DUF3857 domain-containing protein [Planctomycetes bacterium]|nr:DUF3857 domain-containing protein [Planctomycetota bacterium]